ncbi:hypothetical protein D9V84_03640 [Bacteroidetes/Chlorobi group bacterium Naka2016]|nr:MAG: hypothetical protein D9V84_03640 [Bacteroidetes/Chlorobi group bacterium Naka2016]
MDKTKVTILVIIILIIIGGIIYLFVETKPPVYNVKILILNNDYITIDTIANNVSEKLAQELAKDKPTQLNFSYYTTTRIFKPDYELKIRPGEDIQKWKFRIKDYINRSIRDTVLISLENQKINDLVIKFVSDALSDKNPENTFYVITGTFPECYDYESKKTLINSIKELSIKRKNGQPIKLISALVDARKKVEKEIQDSLIATNKFDLKRLDVDLESERKCVPLDLPNVFCIFFDKFTSPNSGEVLEFLTKQISSRFFVTFWNDGPKNGVTLLYLSRGMDSTEFFNTASAMTKCNWTSLNFLFKQALHQISKLPDTVYKHLVFVGKFPESQNEKILKKDLWDSFSKIRNLFWYHYLPEVDKPGQFERNVFPILKKYYKIDVSTNYVLN